MSRTKSSSEIYFLDVPEVTSLSVDFVYNFFTIDEELNENFVDESKFKTFERNFEGYVSSLSDVIPRFNVIKFSPVVLKNDRGERKSLDEEIRQNNLGSLGGNLISDNLDKILSEDHFSFEEFSSVQFSGGDIKNIAYDVTSGSMTQFMFDKYYKGGASNMQKSRTFSALFDQTVDSSFVMASIANFDNRSGVNKFKIFGDDIDRKSGNRKTLFDVISSVYSHAQVNNKIYNDLIKSLVVDPYYPPVIGLKDIQDISNRKTEESKIKDRTSKTDLPYVSMNNSESLFNQVKSSAVIAGYVIDKIEILKSSVILKDQIVIEGHKFGSIIDFNVKYGSTYMYAIRAIYSLLIPVYDEELDRVSVAKILVSSRPSESKYVECIETIAPQSPADFSIHWDNENDRVMLSWSFPLNKQRDIKKFQVFRRKNVSEPFQLIRQYDFNDSLTPRKPIEFPDQRLIDVVSSPKKIYFDDDFNKDSKYIYSVASVDAHELTSGYSDQFEVWFDKRKNRLMKKLVSHSGAPKQYPNMFLEKDLFVDTIKTENKESVSVYFTPDFYQYVNNDGVSEKTFSTSQESASYKISVINLDNQKSEIITVSIDDKRAKTQTSNDAKTIQPNLSANIGKIIIGSKISNKK